MVEQRVRTLLRLVAEGKSVDEIAATLGARPEQVIGEVRAAVRRICLRRQREKDTT